MILWRITMWALTGRADRRAAARSGGALRAFGRPVRPINDRAMFHADNTYWLPVEILSHRLRTNTVSNTAFRGFGGPQGMIAIERVIDASPPIWAAIRWKCGAPTFMRRGATLPLWHESGRQYRARTDRGAGAKLRLHSAPQGRGRLQRGARVLKKGIALTPVKFGISFTATHLNQAGALVLVYADGSIQLNHGGIEMGQGLNIKVAQVVADVFAVP
jgi:xanthine dehydrogenase large subunit